MNKSERGALAVALSLLTSLAAGIGSAFEWSGSRALSLLVGTAFLTMLMVVVSGWVAVRTAKEQRLLREAIGSPFLTTYVRRGIWHWLTRRQWNILSLGVTAVVALTGTFAGVEVVEAHPAAQPTVVATRPVVPVLQTTKDAPQPPPSPSEVTASAAPSSASDTPSTDDSPTADPGTLGTPTTGPDRVTYLDSQDPVNGNSYNHGPVTMSGQRYPRSMSMECESATYNYIEWNVAGNQTFKATLGVADDTSNAYGGVAEMIFYDQDGHQLGQVVDVSLGHPQPVTFSLKGVVHLRITCSARDGKTNAVRYFYGSLGDAQVIG